MSRRGHRKRERPHRKLERVAKLRRSAQRERETESQLDRWRRRGRAGTRGP